MRLLVSYFLLIVFSTPLYSFFVSYNVLLKACPILVKKLKKNIQNNEAFTPSAKQLLRSSIRRFKHTPGFIATINTVLAHTSVFQGSLFEVACSLTINKKTPVIGFNQIKNDLHQKAQFDLILQDDSGQIWVECKKIDWEKAWSNSKRRKSLQEQFIRQLKIVDYNRMTGQNVSYYVCSGTPVTSQWQTWFATNNITYYEHYQKGH